MKPKYPLPNDVVFKILSYLDIDTRRSLAIYTKLKIPKVIEEQISKSINKTIYHNYGSSGKSYAISLDLFTEYTSNVKITYTYEIVHDICNEGTLYYTYDSVILESTNNDRIDPDLNTDRYEMSMFGKQETCFYGYKDRNFIIVDETNEELPQNIFD